MNTPERREPKRRHSAMTLGTALQNGSRRTYGAIAVGLVVILAATLVTARWALGDSDQKLRVIETSDTWEMGNSLNIEFKIPEMAGLPIRVSSGLKTSGIGRDVEAARGTRLVGLSWTLDRRGWQDTRHPVAIAVRTGGQVLPVAELAMNKTSPSDAASVLLSVPAPAADLEVLATYQGRTQSVNVSSGQRDVGAFGWLYRERVGSKRMSRRGEEPWANQVDQVQVSASEAEPLRQGYFEGLGWAPNGQEWVVIPSQTVWVRKDLPFGGDDDWPEATYAMRATGSTFTVDGQAPVKTFPGPDHWAVSSGQQRVYGPRTLVFAVDIGAGFEQRTSIRATVTRPAVGTDRTATEEGTLDLRTAVPPVTVIGGRR